MCSSSGQIGSDDCSPPHQLYDHLLRTIAISVQAACMLVALLLIFLVFRYRKYKVRKIVTIDTIITKSTVDGMRVKDLFWVTDRRWAGHCWIFIRPAIEIAISRGMKSSSFCGCYRWSSIDVVVVVVGDDEVPMTHEFSLLATGLTRMPVSVLFSLPGTSHSFPSRRRRLLMDPVLVLFYLASYSYFFAFAFPHTRPLQDRRGFYWN